jgi:ABC-type transport system substrate-binding protein
MYFFFKTLILLLLVTNSYGAIWNNPHSASKIEEDILFSSFSLPPKHLDPVISYSSNEWSIISQIYEPPLQYNYLKRPYELEPLTLEKMPTIIYMDKNGKSVKENSNRVAYSKYTLNFKKDIKYQNHPAFIKDNLSLTPDILDNISKLSDFKESDTRELRAEDYAYAIKRMAVRQYNSPILDNMQEYIVGLKKFSKKITKIAKEKKRKGEILDLRPYSIDGIKVINSHTLTIKIKGKYPQFLYWLSMNFFAPIPWEADLFYKQRGLIKRNITLNTYPVGTGAYYLATNNPNQEIVLKVNPNYHTEYYPTLDESELNSSNLPKELLKDSGKKLPFIKEIIYSLEKENIPLWNKFLQGYYDASPIRSESFDQAVQISSTGDIGISQEMRDRGIKMSSSIQPSTFYLAFNMVDPIVGGYSESAKKLRQAISIVQNEEEYISIFMNGMGISAQGPIPPAIFGYRNGEDGTNNIVYNWIKGKRVRKSIDEAKRLLAEAGYPNGISIETKRPLVLFYDTTSKGPDDRASMDWRRKQFRKLGIQLVIRATDYNRFQDKVRGGKAQLFSWGWNADYPDPENFLFLLYGKNASVNTNGAGINSSNYQNPKFDKLFEEIKSMKNSKNRLDKIEDMLKIAREDAPWVWGIHPKSLALYHSWYSNVYPNAMANNTLKYKRIDGKLRAKKIKEWNRPTFTPIFALLIFLILISYPLYRAYQNRQKALV